MDLDPPTPFSSRSSTISSLWSLEPLPDQQYSNSFRTITSYTFLPSPHYSFTPTIKSLTTITGMTEAICPHRISTDDGEELLRTPPSPRSPLVSIPDQNHSVGVARKITVDSSAATSPPPLSPPS